MAKSVAVTKLDKIVYPPGCKELTEDLGKDDLIKRLKVSGSVPDPPFYVTEDSEVPVVSF